MKLALNLPPARFRIERKGGEVQIYCRLRQKSVALTPEEWVRQHFVEMLISQLGYPAGLMANEVSLKLNKLQRRADTVVYDHSGRPLMIAEYKAPGVEVTQKTFNQILRYYIALRAKYLVVSNGLQHYCCRITGPEDAPTLEFLNAIPPYNQL